MLAVSGDSGFEEEMDIDDPGCPTVADPALEKQLLNAADPEFLKNLVSDTHSVSSLYDISKLWRPFFESFHFLEV